MEQRRGTQVVRERSAKPLCVGSIPTRASKLSRQLLDFTELRSLPSIGLDRARWGKKGLIRGGGYVKKYVKISPAHFSVSPAPSVGPRTIRAPWVEQKRDEKLVFSIEPLGLFGLGPRHLGRFTAEHRALRVLGRRVDVAFYDTDRVVD